MTFRDVAPLDRVAAENARLLNAIRHPRTSTDRIAHGLAAGTITRAGSCDRKVAYRTPHFAETIAARMSEKFGTPMTYYFCGYCHQYHLTKRAA